MVKTAPASSFVMTKSEFLLEFFVVALDDPAMFRYAHQIFQLGGLGQSGEPVLGRLGFLAGPLDEEPFLGTRFTTPVIAMSRTDAKRCKTGAQCLTSSFPASALSSKRRKAGSWPIHEPRSGRGVNRGAATSWVVRFLSISAWATVLGRVATR